MSRSLEDLEEEAFVLQEVATRVESKLHKLYSRKFPDAILEKDLEGYIGYFRELRDQEFGEAWANFSYVLTRMLNFCRMVRPNAKEVLEYETMERLDEILEKNNDRNWHTSKMGFHAFGESDMLVREFGDTDHPIPYPTKYMNFTDYIRNTARDYVNYQKRFDPVPEKVWKHLDAAAEEMENIYKLFNDAKQACEYIGYDLQDTRQRYDRRRAFLLGSHDRLGSESYVRQLPPEVLALVVNELHRRDS